MVRTAIREGRKEMGKFPWMKIIHHYWAAIKRRTLCWVLKMQHEGDRRVPASQLPDWDVGGGDDG